MMQKMVKTLHLQTLKWFSCRQSATRSDQTLGSIYFRSIAASGLAMRRDLGGQAGGTVFKPLTFSP